MAEGSLRTFRVVAAQATRSFGLVTRSKARRVGATDRMLRHWTTQGLLTQLSRHVWRVNAVPLTPEQTVLAACLAAGPASLASHRTAAALHRLDGSVPLSKLNVVDVLVPAASRVRAPGIVVHRSGALESIDRCRVGIIPATSPLRTIIDLGAVVSREQVEEALDGAERDGKVPRRVLEQRVAELRAPGRSGIGTIASILDRRAKLAALPRSVLERRFLRILEKYGFPKPIAQYPVRRADGRMAYLDFGLPDFLLGFELYGEIAHGTTKQRNSDLVRANELPRWRLVVFTYEDVMYREHYIKRVVENHLAASAA